MCENYDECMNKINQFRKITDLKILYLMAYKKLYVMDMIDRKVIKEFLKFDVDEFNNLLKDLSKLDLWNSDYIIKMEIETF